MMKWLWAFWNMSCKLTLLHIQGRAHNMWCFLLCFRFVCLFCIVLFRRKSALLTAALRATRQERRDVDVILPWFLFCTAAITYRVVIISIELFYLCCDQKSDMCFTIIITSEFIKYSGMLWPWHYVPLLMEMDVMTLIHSIIRFVYFSECNIRCFFWLTVMPL